MKSLLGKIHNLSRLRWALLGFVISLGMPALVLVYYSLSELKWETFHQQRTLAIELTDRINFQIYHWIQVEEQRAYSDYQFLVVSGDPAANYLQPSPLSTLTPADNMPGTLGFFQVDSRGVFSSPSLPASVDEATRFGITADEYQQRNQAREQILQILLDNQLLQSQQNITQDLSLMSPERTLNSAGISSPVPNSTASSTSYFNTSSSSTAQNEMGQEFVQDGLNSKDKPDDVALSSSDRAINVPQPVTTYLNKDNLNTEKQSKPTQAFDNLSQQKSIRDTAVQEKRLLRELDLDSKLQEAVQKKKSAPKVNSSTTYSQPATRKEQTVLPRTPYAEDEDDALASNSYSASPRSAITEEEADSALVSGDFATDFQDNVLPNVTMFESEIDPFEFSPLDDGHMVFFRKVWREGERTIQGLVLDREQFLQGTIGREYRETVLSNVAELVVAYRGNVMSIYRGDRSFTQRIPNQSDSGELLYHTRLAPPFNDMELLYAINQLPNGPGAQVVQWSAIVMALVLGLGTLLIYRLGLRQMRLAQQQQDFVSAVSHELKTPLTSIRMYGEMLREGWADESKKRQYYDYIYDESERLSRLIANVLQLARMNRRELDVTLKSISVAELVDNLRSKLMNQVERGGFKLEIEAQSDLATDQVMVDIDSFLQVAINLIDNALKFSAKSDTKKILLRIERSGSNEIMFAIRDFGPGIDKRHLNKIFDLFYRAENELTRETVGTGIGLALVNQLLRSMNGRIEVYNKEPGAEFCVFLKAVV